MVKKTINKVWIANWEKICKTYLADKGLYSAFIESPHTSVRKANLIEKCEKRKNKCIRKTNGEKNTKILQLHLQLRKIIRFNFHLSDCQKLK